MKHIDIDFHFVRDKFAIGDLNVSHVSTHDQLANLLTKPLPKHWFHLLWSKIGISNGVPSCRAYKGEYQSMILDIHYAQIFLLKLLISFCK